MTNALKYNSIMRNYTFVKMQYKKNITRSKLFLKIKFLLSFLVQNVKAETITMLYSLEGIVSLVYFSIEFMAHFIR